MLNLSDISSNVGFEVFTVVVMNSIIFWDVTPFSLLRCNRRFGGTYRLHLLAENFFFDPEDEGDMFLQNVSCISTDYTASHSRR
jgi:hypothetical protein